MSVPGAVRPLDKASVLARLAVIGLVLAAVGGTFLYLGGWLTPRDLTPARFTDAFEHVDGLHAGFRRNHAKGVGVSGYFEGNGNAVRLSEAVVFRPRRVPVIGRFSLGGGQPYVGDTPDAVRGLGLQFSLPDGELWRTAMVNLPVFPVRTPEGFYQLLLASQPDPGTGKPDPARMGAFLARHPETVKAFAIIKSQPVSSGFGDSTFHSLNAFRFRNRAGDSTPVRWLMTPMQPFEAAGPGPLQGKNSLFDALIAAIHRQPLRWRLIVIVGQPGDLTARSEALYGAWLCGTCLGAVGMALHHKICHTLGGAFGLPHAETHAVMLPHALAYNLPAAEDAGQRLARALNAVGWFHILLGNPAEGLVHCQHALDLQRGNADRFGQGDTLDSIARAYRFLAQYDDAIACYQQALDLYREFGDRYYGIALIGSSSG